MLDTARSVFRRDEMAGARPFYIITTVVLLAVSALTLFRPPSPMPLNRLPLFLTLLTIHLSLHWLSGFLVRRQAVALLIAQALLAAGLALVSQRPELTLALFAALVAETIGLLGPTRLAAASVAGYISLTAASFYAIGGLPMLEGWASPAVSTIALLAVFMLLYRGQETARQHSEALLAELETAHRQLAAYAAQVESLTLTNERQRMARELHDTLSQGVAALVLQLEAANAHPQNGRQERAANIIALSLRRARSTLAESRAAIDDLRLAGQTLTEVLENHTARFTTATGIHCHLDLAFAGEPLVSPPVITHAERIIGECLTNITRHAQASNVWLAVTVDGEALDMTIRDDGLGFDVQRVEKQGHYGLLGMRERARLLGGAVVVNSEIGTGTEVKITLPLEAS